MPCASTQASPLEARTILKGTTFLKFLNWIKQAITECYTLTYFLHTIIKKTNPNKSFCTSDSSKRRPIKRFVAYKVFCEFVTACRLAGAPTNLSPSLVNATTDGVVLTPSEFSITYKHSMNWSPQQTTTIIAKNRKIFKAIYLLTFACLPSITATHEFVVPRSIPITAPRTPLDLKPYNSYR